MHNKEHTSKTLKCRCRCIFVSIKFTETSADKANKKHQKGTGSKFMFKMPTIHAHTCSQTTSPLCNCCCNDGVVQQPPLPQQTFFQLVHIMDLQTVDPLEGYPRHCSPPDSNPVNWVATSLGYDLWCFSL